VRVGAVRTLAVASVAGRWTSQLPPRSWTVTGPDPRGVPAADAPPGEPGGSTLVALASPSERSRLRRTRRTRTEVPAGSASRVLPAVCPFAVHRRCVHSRRRAAGAAVAFGVGFPGPTSRSAPVVSHHLGGFLRTVAAGLLHPAPGLGVRRVAGRPSPPDPPGSGDPRAGGTRAPFPATRTPFEGFPSSAAVPHRCGRCLPAVAACPTTRRPKPRVPKRPKARPGGARGAAGSTRTRRRIR
jgi:hypothetical protein